MSLRSLCITAILLWLLGVAVLAWLFVSGSTEPGRDQRTAVVLTSQERAFVLAEMRQLLAAVHGVLAGLSHQDPVEGKKLAIQAARSGGMAQAADVDPSLMLKLPLAFKQMGMSVHRDLDRLAEDLTKEASASRVISALASITSRCVACHDAFQLRDADPPAVGVGEPVGNTGGERGSPVGFDKRRDLQLRAGPVKSL